MLRFLLIFLLCYGQLSAQNSRPSKAPVPNWVTPVTIDYANTSMDDDAEDGYISMNYEKQVSLKDECTFVRFANRVITEAGVQNESQISLSFDPTYERLTFHSIRIIRGAEIIDKLELSKLKVVQQESELNNFIYNGSLNAMLFLEDVRKGDIIECSYSRKGFNPVFGHKYYDNFNTQFSSPCYQYYYKVLVPEGRHLTVKNTIDTLSPVITTQNAQTVYEWQRSKVKPIHTQDYLPSWFEVFPEIMVSEFDSWKAVNDWSRAIFPKKPVLSPALVKHINAIAQADTNAEARLLKALRFVEDDIRYMGMEMGVHSHKPADPGKVFSQRFGDCKEKSYLLCCMLNAMGIPAEPILINTDYKHSLLNWLPSPGAFDHVTLRAMLNGKWHYFDPTIAYQRGGVDDIYYPDYQTGLVITDTTTALTVIPHQQKGKVNTKEVFDIVNLNGDAKLHVTTVYTGTFADDVRYSFKSNSRHEMLDTYKKYYASYFEQISADSLQVVDNDTTGGFTTEEFYSIENIWKTTDGIQKMSLLPFVLQAYMKEPKEKKRTMPFAISFPANYHETILVNLPETWNSENSEKDIICGAFKLHIKFSGHGDQIELDYDFENLKDHVLPEEAKDYLAKIDEGYDAINYEITYNTNSTKAETVSSGSSSSSLGTLYTLALLTVLVISVVKIYQRWH